MVFEIVPFCQKRKCPPHPHPRRQSRFPSVGENMQIKQFLVICMIVCDLLPPHPHPQRQSKLPSVEKK